MRNWWEQDQCVASSQMILFLLYVHQALILSEEIQPELITRSQAVKDTRMSPYPCLLRDYKINKIIFNTVFRVSE